MGTQARRSIRRSARPVLRGAAATACLLALGGCATNFGAQTNKPYQPADGVTVRDGDIYALNALVVGTASEDADAGNGTVVVALVNQAETDDALTAYSAEADGDKIEAEPLPALEATESDLASPPAKGVLLPSGVSVQTAGDGALRLTGEAIRPGTVVTLTFEFTNAAAIEVEVPVVAVGTSYTAVPLGPVTVRETDAAAPSE